jgi:hypothetical protein
MTTIQMSTEIVGEIKIGILEVTDHSTDETFPKAESEIEHSIMIDQIEAILLVGIQGSIMKNLDYCLERACKIIARSQGYRRLLIR